MCRGNVKSGIAGYEQGCFSVDISGPYRFFASVCRSIFFVISGSIDAATLLANYSVDRPSGVHRYGRRALRRRHFERLCKHLIRALELADSL